MGRIYSHSLTFGRIAQLGEHRPYNATRGRTENPGNRPLSRPPGRFPNHLPLALICPVLPLFAGLVVTIWSQWRQRHPGVYRRIPIAYLGAAAFHFREASVRNSTWLSDAAPCDTLSSLALMEEWHGKTDGKQGVVGGAGG